MSTFLHLLSGLKIVVEEDPMGGFYGVVPALPGCGSQGDTINDTLVNVEDAVMTVLDVLREDDPDRLQQVCGVMTQIQAILDEDQWDTTASNVGIVAGLGS